MLTEFTSFWWREFKYCTYLAIEFVSAYVQYHTLKAMVDAFVNSIGDDEILKATKRKMYFKVLYMWMILFVTLTLAIYVESNYYSDISIGQVKNASQTIFAIFITFFLLKSKKNEKDHANKDNDEIEIATVV